MPSDAALSTGTVRPSALAAAGAFLLGLATIAGAWGFQIFGHYVPCKLCLEERIPYYVGVPLALLALLAALTGRERATRILLALVAIVFLIGAGLGVYHAGVEWGWWLGPADCGATAPPPGSVEDLMRQVQNIRIVSCTEASWRFLGLSFAGWNAVVSAGLVVIAAWGALAATARRHPRW